MVKTFDFGKNLVIWINILPENQESYIVNGGITTKYFKLERGTRQGNPIFAYLFDLVLVVVFTVIKSNQNIDELRVFDHGFLSTTYADDTTSFVKNQTSVKVIWKVFINFPKIFGLKPNKLKCEIAGRDALKGVRVDFAARSAST